MMCQFCVRLGPFAKLLSGFYRKSLPSKVYLEKQQHAATLNVLDRREDAMLLFRDIFMDSMSAWKKTGPEDTVVAQGSSALDRSEVWWQAIGGID
ncbi:hypothetical protein AB5N19_11234 [Seiridium cardinale]|uniref:Uncharacterized protein n=1 Tax=Seiridium cardinale TaxID=138064 RepID=A0ABR2XS97_9PEZI